MCIPNMYDLKFNVIPRQWSMIRKPFSLCMYVSFIINKKCLKNKLPFDNFLSVNISYVHIQYYIDYILNIFGLVKRWNRSEIINNNFLLNDGSDYFYWSFELKYISSNFHPFVLKEHDFFSISTVSTMITDMTSNQWNMIYVNYKISILLLLTSIFNSLHACRQV